MRLFRVEDDHGNGPYVYNDIPVCHAHWFHAPYLTEQSLLRRHDYHATTEDGKFRIVFAMEQEQDLLAVFALCNTATEIPVTEYEVPASATEILYDYEGASAQWVFDRSQATVVRRYTIPANKFYGHTLSSCPQHLRKPNGSYSSAV